MAYLIKFSNTRPREPSEHLEEDNISMILIILLHLMISPAYRSAENHTSASSSILIITSNFNITIIDDNRFYSYHIFTLLHYIHTN